MSTNPPLDPNRPVTASQLAHYLFGNPDIDPRDEGLIGRISREQRESNAELDKKVGVLTRWNRAVFITFLGAVFTLLANLVVNKGGIP